MDNGNGSWVLLCKLLLANACCCLLFAFLLFCFVANQNQKKANNCSKQKKAAAAAKKIASVPFQPAMKKKNGQWDNKRSIISMLLVLCMAMAIAVKGTLLKTTIVPM